MHVCACVPETDRVKEHVSVAETLTELKPVCAKILSKFLAKSVQVDVNLCICVCMFDIWDHLNPRLTVNLIQSV